MAESLENSISDSFNIEAVFQSLSKCSEDLSALSMDQYLISFREFYRFFMLLGTVFGFVASDIISKVKILEEYKESNNAAHYSTIQSMLAFEKSNGVVDDSIRPSGSRTLLRLHRSLEFIMCFMKDLSSSPSDSKSSSIAQECYKKTLSRYHPWLIQKGAYFAMYTLPVKQEFIKRVSGGTFDENSLEKLEKIMASIALESQKIYDQTQRLYEEHDLLDLA